MNPKLLIDAIVQQTTVLIAQLSTSAGVRAPLARIADQVFVDLARELESQGVGKKVAADMFGMALRTYQLKVNRLEGSVSEKGSTLWEAVLAYVEENENCDRKELYQHFDADDPLSIGAVLKDLCDSALLYRTGTGSAARFRLVPTADRLAVQRAQDVDAFAAMVRVALYRGASSRDDLVRRLGADPERVDEALELLESEGAIERDASGLLLTGRVSIPPGASVGWEAAVFDHYQALVTAVTRKVAAGAARSERDDQMGGATVSFELSDGNQHEHEVHATLKRVRREVNALWQKVGREEKRLAETRSPDEEPEIVTFYFGQSIQEGRR